LLLRLPLHRNLERANDRAELAMIEINGVFGTFAGAGQPRGIRRQL
jgi:hypothetical protein